jgi:cytochrome c biogenesis factor
MLFSEYLHEKAEESRHNETIGYLIVIIGSIFFVGGLLETVIKVESPEWFLIIPYYVTSHPYSLLGLTLTSIGLVLLCLGIGLAIHYARERSWYMKEIQKAHLLEEQKLKFEKKGKSALQDQMMIRTKKKENSKMH